MKKILFAINHRITEQAIAERINDEYMVVDAVTYKEAILEKLRTTGADTLLIRDTLPGSMDLERLMNRVRVEYPKVRVVVICAERPKNDPFLQALISLGIYDIINSDKPTLADIVSYIRTPRTYRDAAQYGIGLPEGPHNQHSSDSSVHEPAHHSDTSGKSPSKGGGFGKMLGDFKKGVSSLKKPASAPEPAPVQPVSQPVYSGKPQVNAELLRETIKESEARAAQQNMDALIRKAVDDQTTTLKAENLRLAQEVESLKAELSVSSDHSSSVIEELNQMRSERDKIQVAYDDLRRETQQGYEIYEQQLRALQNPVNTPEWYQEQSALWEHQKNNLTTALEEKTTLSDRLSFEVETLSLQVKADNEKITELTQLLQRARDTQLSAAGADDLVERLRAEASDAKHNEELMAKRLADAEAELEIAREGGPDCSRPLVDVPLLPDDSVYQFSGRAPQTVLMVGSKHGVGTTTLALNVATSLASHGYKTLLVEINGNFPMLNQYFELTNIPYGINEALSDIANGNMSNVDKAIIRPHGLRPTQKNLVKAYKQLPQGLHFMLFSNESLVARSYETNASITEASVFTLLRYLTRQQQYSHIILDVQSDDYKMLSCILGSGYPIDKMVMVMTQDPHAVMTAGTMIMNLSSVRAASLVAGGEFIVNRYNPNAAITSAKIESVLHLGANQISKLGEDSLGFLSASDSAVPYLLNKGKFWMDIDSLRKKIFGNV